MQLALNQARKSLGNTKDNPAVGCVIVKNNTVISAGNTSFNGRPHAEYNAIKSSKKSLKDTHIYVTLEPCSHYGKTPPCVKKIIKTKAKKVFISVKDPDIRSYGKSIKSLNKHNISVNVGTLSHKIMNFYKSYYKSRSKLLPFVTSKLAVSKDFYTINTKKNHFITNNFSRGRVHLMRSFHDCIMTSSQTIIKDNPMLTCRIDGLKNSSPSRIILDNKLKISIYSKIVREANLYKTIVFFNKYNKNKIKLFKKMKIKTFQLPLDNSGNLDLKECLLKSKKLGFSRIFLETGLKLTKKFLEKNLVDDFKLFISNKNLKKNGKANANKYIINFFKKKKKITERVNLFGDKLISYSLK